MPDALLMWDYKKWVFNCQAVNLMNTIQPSGEEATQFCIEDENEDEQDSRFPMHRSRRRPRTRPR